MLHQSGCCFSDNFFPLTTRATQQMSIYVTISHFARLVICFLLLLTLQRSLPKIYLCRCVLRLWEEWDRMLLGLHTLEGEKSIHTPSLPLQGYKASQWIEKGIRICSSLALLTYAVATEKVWFCGNHNTINVLCLLPSPCLYTHFPSQCDAEPSP